MARADTYTQLPLDRYAFIMGINPYHFNNLDDGNYPDACKDYWIQDNHNFIADHIENAETMMRDVMTFNVSPIWQADEVRQYSYARKMRRDWWKRGTILTEWGYLQKFGVETLTLAEADVATGINNGDTTATFTVNVAAVGGVSVTDPSEIAVFYRVADGAVEAASDVWEIRPLTVTIAAGVATITGPVYLFTDPDILARDATQPQGDASLATSYVTAVDVYRRWNYTETPVTLYWDQLYGGSEVEAWVSQTGAGRIIDRRLGRFQPLPAVWYAGAQENRLSCLYDTAPDLVRANYQAGYPLGPDGNLAPPLEKAVVRLSNTLMPCEPQVLCDPAGVRWHDDRFDAQNEGEQELTLGTRGNPWGFYKGALFAYKVAQRFRIQRNGGRV